MKTRHSQNTLHSVFTQQSELNLND